MNALRKLRNNAVTYQTIYELNALIVASET